MQTPHMDLSNYYQNYLTALALEMNISKVLNGDSKNTERTRYELYNIMERYLVTKAHGFDPQPQFLCEIEAKNLTNYAYLETMAESFVVDETPDKKKLSGLLSYQQFVFNNKEVIKIMKSLCKDKDHVDERMLACILNYSGLLLHAQEWTPPLAETKKRIQDFVTGDKDKYLIIEAFASPMYSQLCRLMYDDKSWDNPQYAYCSLFPETDSVFGSAGKFMSLDINSVKQELVSNVLLLVNPPHIEQVINAAATKCLDILEKSPQNTKIVFYAPNWQDTDFYKHLSTSDKLTNITHRNTVVNEYFCQVINKKIQAKFNLVVFELTA